MAETKSDGKFIQEAIKRPGALTARAKRKGRSILAQAREDVKSGTTLEKSQGNIKPWEISRFTLPEAYWFLMDPKDVGPGGSEVMTDAEIDQEVRHWQGMTWLEKEGVEYPFWATVSVREKAVLKIKDSEYEVYIIDFSFIEDHPEGTKNFVKTIWYSPEFETSLRTDYIMGDEVFSMRMVAFNSPEDLDNSEESEPEGLGTVRL